MKRLILLGVFAIFLFILPFRYVFAQGKTDQQNVKDGQIELSITTVPTATPSPTVQHVDYPLPYPGLLPDNPLYVFKAIRDKIIEFLISDPAKKAEFYLLSSDKRVNTGYYLILKGENDMGVLYISKSNSYLSMANTQAFLAGERGKGTLQNIKKSILKHEEVINLVKPKVDYKNRTKLDYELGRLVQLQSLMKKK